MVVSSRTNEPKFFQLIDLSRLRRWNADATIGPSVCLIRQRPPAADSNIIGLSTTTNRPSSRVLVGSMPACVEDCPRHAEAHTPVKGGACVQAA
jgi:hypothetical protein